MPARDDLTNPDLPTLAAAVLISGSALSSVSDSSLHASTTFTAVDFYDHAAPAGSYRDRIVMGAGLPPSDYAAVLRRLDADGAAALVVRLGEDTDLDPQWSGASAVAIVNFPRGDWAHMANILRSLLSGFSTGHVSGVRLGDVFGLANALASLAEGAVSIVDSTGQVVGYSTHADQPIDDIRRRSTLMLQEEVPLAEDREYQAILRSAGAMHFPSSDDQYSRVGAAVRAAGELLGTVWVVQIESEGAPRTQALLDDMEPIVAEHLLRARDNAAQKNHRTSELLRSLVEEEHNARGAASQLLIQPEAGCTAVCFRVNTYDEVLAVRGLQRLMHLAISVAGSRFGGSHTAIIEPHVVTLVPESSLDRVRAFAESVVRTDSALIAGVGTRVITVPGIARSYRDAVATTTLLMSLPNEDPHGRSDRTASFEQVRDLVALRQIGDVIEGLDAAASDSAARLMEHDLRHNADLARTTLTYLNARGSVRETAETLHVHQNTVRYRLEVVRGDLGIDLDAGATRLWLWLRLFNSVAR